MGCSPPDSGGRPGTVQSKSGGTAEALSFSSSRRASMRADSLFFASLTTRPISGRRDASSRGNSLSSPVRLPCLPRMLARTSCKPVSLRASRIFCSASCRSCSILSFMRQTSLYVKIVRNTVSCRGKERKNRPRLSPRDGRNPRYHPASAPTGLHFCSRVLPRAASGLTRAGAHCLAAFRRKLPY